MRMADFGFVNACRHRGVVVEEEERGIKRRFVCPFHSWSYDPKGALVGLPKEEQFGEIDKECFGLVELPTEEKYGFLFVHPNPQAQLMWTIYSARILPKNLMLGILVRLVDSVAIDMRSNATGNSRWTRSVRHITLIRCIGIL